MSDAPPLDGVVAQHQRRTAARSIFLVMCCRDCDWPQAIVLSRSDGTALDAVHGDQIREQNRDLLGGAS